MHDWLAELIALPVKEYPTFEAALSFLPALAPEDAVRLLEERMTHLEVELARHEATRGVLEKSGLPRLFWVESEFHAELRRAELVYVRTLTAEIRAGVLDGTTWWRAVYADPDHPELVPAPFLDDSAVWPAES
jgi:hypothetical protein